MTCLLPSAVVGCDGLQMSPLLEMPWLASPQTGQTSLWSKARHLLCPKIITTDQADCCYFTGTSMQTLLEVLVGGGSLAPDITHLSTWRFRSLQYAVGRAWKDMAPGVVLGFRKNDIQHLIRVSDRQPDWTTSGDLAERWEGGVAEFHVAIRPIPLFLMHPTVKKEIMVWFENRVSKYSEVKEPFLRGAELFSQGLQV